LAEVTFAPATSAAIADKVSPRCTRWVEPAPAGSSLLGAGSACAARAGRECDVAGFGAGSAGVGADAACSLGIAAACSVGAGCGGVSVRAIDPSRAPCPVVGAATGAAATCDSPGV